MADAERVILKGQLLLYRSAVPGGVRRDSLYGRRYANRLARYGLTFDPGYCEIEPDHDAGYEHRMAQEILQRFGADFWQRIDHEAREKRRPLAVPGL